MLKTFPCEYCNATLPIQDSPLQTCPSCQNPCWPAEVKAWSRAGQKINAIKVYRFMTNVGLKEAKDAVDAFPVKGFLAIPPGLAVPAAPSAPAPTSQNNDAAFEQEIRGLLKSNLINAIKRYREYTGVGLKESKDTVEAMRDGKPYTLHPPSRPAQPAQSAGDVRTQIMDLIQQGKFIEAIKLYREKTNVGLKEAKDAIDAARAGQPISISVNLISVNQAQELPSSNREAEIMECIRQNNKIAAIKAYREVTGLGLKEAKDAVEAFMRGEGPLFSTPPTGSVAATPAPSDPNAALRAELLSVLESEGFINAIRVYRERTGVGLKEGKDFIEALEQDPKAPFPVV